MTKLDFIDWKSDPRTKEIFKFLEQECFTIAESLAHSAGLNPISDRYQVGVIRGMERMLEIDYEETEEDA